MGDEKLADIFDALGDVRRVRALRFIAEQSPSAPDPGEAVCACHVQEHLGLSQPATSYHLKILRQAGLVAAEKHGRWVHYRVADRGLEQLSAFLSEMGDAGRVYREGAA